MDVPMDTAQLTLDGNAVNLREYVGAWSEKLCADDVLKFRTERLPEGDYERSAIGERHFDPGCVVINGLDMDRAAVSLRYTVRVFRPAVVSSFEVASRGRHYVFSSIQLGEIGVKMSMTSVP